MGGRARSKSRAGGNNGECYEDYNDAAAGYDDDDHSIISGFIDGSNNSTT